MSKQDRRSGKRTRDGAAPPRESLAPAFLPAHYPTEPSPIYPNQQQFQVPIDPKPQPQILERRASSSIGIGPPTLLDVPSRSQRPVGKIAIPPLPRGLTSEQSQKQKKGRTAHACDACRRAKAGCSGGQPCSRCRNTKGECVYGDGKRARDRKRLSKLSKDTTTLSQQNLQIIDALKRIQIDGSLSSAEIRAGIDDILFRAPARLSPNDAEPSKYTDSTIQPEEDPGSECEEDDESEVGSTNSIDVISTDPDRDDTRATGHIGKSSSMSWAKRATEEVNHLLDPHHPGRHSDLALASYHTEDADVDEIDTSFVGPYDWPDAPLADFLVQTYFNFIHTSLPLVDKKTFMTTYSIFARGSRDISLEDGIWLGTLNIMFAISSIYLYLTRNPQSPLPNDHLVYLARAKKLCLDEGLLYQDARMSMTCLLGLMCLYSIAACKLNRAWTFGGLAIRQALTLGLHNRNQSRDLSNTEKEHRIRLWWSLFSLECCLTELTGRPSCIFGGDISTPMPINVDEDMLKDQPIPDARKEDVQSSDISTHASHHHSFRPLEPGGPQTLAYAFLGISAETTNSTYFIYRTQLSILSHDIVTQVYCASAIQRKWTDVQAAINSIDKRLISWKETLPTNFAVDFDFYSPQDWADAHTSERIGHAMLYSSCRMILFRPCLCRFEGRRNSHQSSRSKEFNQGSAESCISAARTLISLLSLSITNPTSTARSPSARFHLVPPFWLTLHYLCEALAILTLEMAFQALHVGVQEAADILEDAKKGIMWLIDMSSHSVSARKAWEIFDRLVRLVAPMICWSVFDLPTEAPIPPGYNWRRFSATQQGQSRYTPWQEPFPFPTQDYYPPSEASYQQQDFASNPLDHSTAVEKFSSIGARHGHYDEPWRHMFEQPEEDLARGTAGDPLFPQPYDVPEAAFGGFEGFAPVDDPGQIHREHYEDLGAGQTSYRY